MHSQKDNLSYQTQLGLALINQGKFSEAKKILEKVLEKEENNYFEKEFKIRITAGNTY